MRVLRRLAQVVAAGVSGQNLGTFKSLFCPVASQENGPWVKSASPSQKTRESLPKQAVAHSNSNFKNNKLPAEHLEPSCDFACMICVWEITSFSHMPRPVHLTHANESKAKGAAGRALRGPSGDWDSGDMPRLRDAARTALPATATSCEFGNPDPCPTNRYSPCDSWIMHIYIYTNVYIYIYLYVVYIYIHIYYVNIMYHVYIYIYIISYNQ